jgi:hypothetical protein
MCDTKGEIGNEKSISVENMKERAHLGGLGIDGKICGS